jgi:hypothetical protein
MSQTSREQHGVVDTFGNVLDKRDRLGYTWHDNRRLDHPLHSRDHSANGEHGCKFFDSLPQQEFTYMQDSGIVKVNTFETVHPGARGQPSLVLVRLCENETETEVVTDDERVLCHQ